MIEYLRTRADENKIRDMFREKGWMMRPHVTQEIKDMKRVLDDKYFEDEKEYLTDFVEAILSISEEYDITNVEALAIIFHMLKDMGGKKLVGHWRSGVHEAKRRANALRLENWDKFMRILKYAE